MKKRWQDFYIGVECEHHQIWIDTDNGNVFCDKEFITNTSKSNWENEIEDYKYGTELAIRFNKLSECSLCHELTKIKKV